MKRAEKNKKIMKIIVGIVAVAMIVSTFASFFAFGGSNSGKNPQVEDSEAKNDDKTADKINTEITDTLKKDMANAKVEVKEKEVIGVINVSEAANKAQADKVADEYTKTLKEKYKDKNLKVQVVYNKEKLAESNTYVNVNKDVASKLPKMNVQISSGLTNIDRYVAVSLETDKPEQYQVAALGQTLVYVPTKKIFHGVVESTDEEAIKKSIKVTLKK